MDFIEIAKKCYSVRSYRDKLVEEEKLKKILEAAHAAPTVANLQPVRLIAVQSREFGLPDYLEPVNILAIGYPDEEAADPERHAQTRIPLEELVSYETI